MKGDLVSAKRCRTLPKSCGSQSSEWKERKKIRAVWISIDSRMPESSRGGIRVSSILIARQMEVLEAVEEERTEEEQGRKRLAL